MPPDVCDVDGAGCVDMADRADIVDDVGWLALQARVRGGDLPCAVAVRPVCSFIQGHRGPLTGLSCALGPGRTGCRKQTLRLRGGPG